MANLSRLRRYFGRFKEGIRDQCIERANTLQAIKFYNLRVMSLGWRTFHMAIGRSNLIKKRNAHYNQVFYLFLTNVIIHICITQNESNENLER